GQPDANTDCSDRDEQNAEDCEKKQRDPRRAYDRGEVLPIASPVHYDAELTSRGARIRLDAIELACLAEVARGPFVRPMGIAAECAVADDDFDWCELVGERCRDLDPDAAHRHTGNVP